MKQFALNSLSVLLLFLLAGCLSPFPDPHAEDTEPIETASFSGWKEAYELKNPWMRVIVVPAAGRIVHIGFADQFNMLRHDNNLAGMDLAKEREDSFVNIGGDWIWPVAQSRWNEFSDGNWPPPPVLADRPWKGEAWKDSSHRQHCRMTRKFGEPLNVTLTRHITLFPGEPKIAIRQRIERTALSNVPVTLWQISQVAHAERVFIPISRESSFEGGYKIMMGDPPGRKHVLKTKSVLVYDALEGGEHKLGFDTRPAWIAAQKGQVLMVERIIGGPRGDYPDGGCTLQMYSNTGLGYAEIETLSAEKLLKPGRSIENTLLIECLPFPPNMESKDAAEMVEDLAGE